MKIFLSVLFLLIFGLFILLATVDLEPYFTPKKESASQQSPPQTPPTTDLSTQDDETAQPENDTPPQITTHQLIVTSGRLQTAKSEETGDQGSAETIPQAAADPVVDDTLPPTPQNDRP